jgi:ADP-ribose pyrophosphatase YjhB (NUDIX family)
VARRIDFYDDAAAPKANSLVPSVNVVVTNPGGDVLLIRRSDNQNWAVPGGAIDLGESMVQAAVRETLEETGIDCEITGLVGIYTDPKHVILYTSNGEARQGFSILLTARATGGAPTRAVMRAARCGGCRGNRLPSTRWTGRCGCAYVITSKAVADRTWAERPTLSSSGRSRVNLAYRSQDHRRRAAH